VHATSWCALRRAAGALADRLASYNLRRLASLRAGYLAGFAAEAYAVELGDGHARAQKQMDAAQAERCAREVGGDTYKNLLVRNRYQSETFRYALLPVWIATYRYRKKSTVSSSRPDAEVSGQAPYSVFKSRWLACSDWRRFCHSVSAVPLPGAALGSNRWNLSRSPRRAELSEPRVSRAFFPPNVMRS